MTEGVGNVIDFPTEKISEKVAVKETVASDVTQETPVKVRKPRKKKVVTETTTASDFPVEQVIPVGPSEIPEIITDTLVQDVIDASAGDDKPMTQGELDKEFEAINGELDKIGVTDVDIDMSKIVFLPNGVPELTSDDIGKLITLGVDDRENLLVMKQLAEQSITRELEHENASEEENKANDDIRTAAIKMLAVWQDIARNQYKSIVDQQEFAKYMQTISVSAIKYKYTKNGGIYSNFINNFFSSLHNRINSVDYTRFLEDVSNHKNIENISRVMTLLVIRKNKSDLGKEETESILSIYKILRSIIDIFQTTSNHLFVETGVSSINPEQKEAVETNIRGARAKGWVPFVNEYYGDDTVALEDPAKLSRKLRLIEESKEANVTRLECIKTVRDRIPHIKSFIMTMINGHIEALNAKPKPSTSENKRFSKQLSDIMHKNGITILNNAIIVTPESEEVKFNGDDAIINSFVTYIMYFLVHQKSVEEFESINLCVEDLKGVNLTTEFRKEIFRIIFSLFILLYTISQDYDESKFPDPKEYIKDEIFKNVDAVIVEELLPDVDVRSLRETMFETNIALYKNTYQFVINLIKDLPTT